MKWLDMLSTTETQEDATKVLNALLITETELAQPFS